MPDLDALLKENRSAVDELLAAAAECEDRWTAPRAPGKWSPSQLVEHVARSLEEGGNVVTERPSKLPSLPFFVRPLAKLFFKRVLKKRGFPKARTTKAMNPIDGPATLEEARQRLETALAKFESDCRARTSTGRDPVSPAFGRITVADYADFVALHTRHHTAQLPVGG